MAAEVGLSRQRCPFVPPRGGRPDRLCAGRVAERTKATVLKTVSECADAPTAPPQPAFSAVFPDRLDQHYANSNSGQECSGRCSKSRIEAVRRTRQGPAMMPRSAVEREAAMKVTVEDLAQVPQVRLLERWDNADCVVHR